MRALLDFLDLCALLIHLNPHATLLLIVVLIVMLAVAAAL